MQKKFDALVDISITDSYYTLTLGDTQGNLVYASPSADFPSQKNTIAGVDYYVRSQLISNVAVSDITSSSASIGWEGADAIRAFVLNFGSGEQTGLSSTRSDVNTADALWYSLDGRRLNGRPTQGGVYLNNGRKVVIR